MPDPSVDSEATVIDGRYRLVRKIGSGGSATVYEAEQLAVGRRVAIKLFYRTVTDDPEFHARFAEEVRKAARIQHANVIDVLDLGVAETGRPYVVMGLLEGETLAGLVQTRGPVPPLYACDLLLQVAAGLGAAHRKGMIHGDLKPTDLMVTHPRPHRPLVRLLDFGMARSLRGPHGKPVVASSMPSFMAPEHLLGQPVDERTDVYGAASVLYLLLTGKAPFEGETSQAILDRVARGSLCPIREVNPSLPRELGALVTAGMSLSRRDRIGSVEELAEKIRGFVRQASIEPPLRPRDSQRPETSVKKDGATFLSEIPESEIVRLNVSPWVVTESLLVEPRLPKPPARPKLEIGRDFRPLPGDPEGRDSLLKRLTIRSRRAQAGVGAASVALLVGLGAGVLMAWLAGLI